MSLTANNNIRLGEIGRTISIDSGGYDLTGATMTVIITSPSGTKTPYSATLAANNLSVTILTTAPMFPTIGNYQVQLQYVKAGVTLLSLIGTISVQPSL